MKRILTAGLVVLTLAVAYGQQLPNQGPQMPNGCPPFSAQLPNCGSQVPDSGAGGGGGGCSNGSTDLSTTCGVLTFTAAGLL